ncbi:MAG: sigma factor-like helix-turn-helix DNA-binding protein [Candidatus Pacebacteria bacterium]|nr:sigma factor-like helix-turn-helix DNA-binding protein [Candidatus Paceibacterota bacterium]
MELEYKTIVQNILKNMPDRTKSVLSRRFSIGKKARGETLEAIGKSYKITRERVRQIEADGLKRAKKIAESPEIKADFKKAKTFFEEKIGSSGGVKNEELLLSEISTPETRNYVLFLLNLSDSLKRGKEDQSFYPFWAVDEKSAAFAKKVAESFVKKFKDGAGPESLDNLFASFEKEYADEIKKKSVSKDMLMSYLEISKEVFKTMDGQKIGLRSSPEVNPRTVREKIRLILKSENKPLHFKEITEYIFKLNKELEQRENRGYKLHPQTVHNELIRNEDFVLVGRGFYALKDWGYYPGRVKDVIYNVLQASNNPLSKEEIIEQVGKQRIVKASTVFLSLQNKKIFEKNNEGKYKIKEA